MHRLSDKIWASLCISISERTTWLGSLSGYGRREARQVVLRSQ